MVTMLAGGPAGALLVLHVSTWAALALAAGLLAAVTAGAAGAGVSRRSGAPRPASRSVAPDLAALTPAR